MTKKSRIILGSVVGVAILGAVVAISINRESRKTVEVQIQKAGLKDLTSIVSASGEVKPQKFVDISANVSGRITELLVKEGDRVKKGQVLVRIDSARFVADADQSRAAVQAQRAELNRAEAELAMNRLAFERMKKMHVEQLVSDQQYDESAAQINMQLANVDALKRRVSQTQAGYVSVKDNLDKTTVASPMDGYVTSLVKEEGEVVIGAQSFQPTVIMTVADLSVMECEVMVDETDIRNLALGQSAEIRVDALQDLKIKGSVTEIGSSAVARGGTVAAASANQSTANQAKDFKVTITLADPPSTIRPGLNATADITTARKEKVLAVPIQAVVARTVDANGKVVNPGDEAVPNDTGNVNTVTTIKTKVEEKEGVFVVNAGKAAFRSVKTGIIGDTDIEITDGLKSGDDIVTGSYKALRTLKEDAKVKPEVRKGGQA